MVNGRITVQKTDGRVEAVFIDQESLEFARQNRMVQDRLEQQADRKRESAQKAAKASRRKNRLVRRIAGLAVAVAAVWAAWGLGQAGMGLALAVTGISLADGAYRIGGYRNGK